MYQTKEQQQSSELQNNFTAFERAVLTAWLDRSLDGLPTYHPAKAVKIYQRWPAIIERALRVITPLYRRQES